MARVYDSMQNSVITFLMRLTTDTFPTHSVCVLARPNNPPLRAGLLDGRTSASSTRLGFQTGPTTSPRNLMLYDTVGTDPESTLTITNEGWCLYGATQVSNAVVPRFHKFVFNTNVWTHEAGSAVQASPGAPGAGAAWNIGRSATDGASWHGDIAAAGYWRRAMSDSEFKRLARGQWTIMNPEFLWEGNTKDIPDGWGRDLGRGRQVFSATGFLTRTNVVDAPGFRFSVEGRRR